MSHESVAKVSQNYKRGSENVRSSAPVKRETKKERKSLDEEVREKTIINKAINMAEEQIDNRTASSQVLVHFLKLGTVMARLELERLENENELLRAKKESIQSQSENKDLLSKVLAAMRLYTGQDSDDDY